MGEHLTLRGGTYPTVSMPYEVTYPHVVRNCTKCHRNVALADTYTTQPSRRACGACHDDVSFLASPPAARSPCRRTASPPRPTSTPRRAAT